MSPRPIRSLRRQTTLPERHDLFLSMKEVNEFIAALELAYEQTQNEMVAKVLARLRAKRDETVRLEELFREDEMAEFWENPGSFPHAVRVWFMAYRDDEMDY